MLRTVATRSTDHKTLSPATISIVVNNAAEIKKNLEKNADLITIIEYDRSQ